VAVTPNKEILAPLKNVSADFKLKKIEEIYENY